MRARHVLQATVICLALSMAAGAAEIIPPVEKIVKDHPRVMLRPKSGKHWISLEQLKALPRDAEFKKVLGRLRGDRTASSQAMVWLLTGDRAAADKAVKRMTTYKAPRKMDAFDAWFRCREMGLTYDWLYNYPGFTKEMKTKTRANMAPVVRAGLRVSDDHVFHNYVWMGNSGLAIWALATAGEDAEADKLLKTIRSRYLNRLFPAMEHLNGLPGDAMGYWYVYCPSSFAWALMGLQSAFETDVAGAIEKHQGKWLSRQLESMVLSTLPDMRFIPWGDMQRGADGGVTHEIAGPADALTWALKSPTGAHFGRWLAGKRGVSRFFREHGALYFLYTRHLKVEPKDPPLAMRAGADHGGHALMRSSWKDDATIVGLRCGDFYSGHSHWDRGTFVIYRNGLLACDAGYYGRYRGPQLSTNAHNTLLLGGKSQRFTKGTWFKDLAAFKAQLNGRYKLEQGDMPFFKHEGTWTAVSCEFAKAYAPGTVKTCARQLLYIRPGIVVVVDSIVAAKGKNVPEIQWMLQLPTDDPTVAKGTASFSNGKSWLRCRSLTDPETAPVPSKSLPAQLSRDHKKLSPVTRITYTAKEQPGTITMVHLIDVGDGQPGPALKAKHSITDDAVEVTVSGKTYTFSRTAPYAISAR
jgi:heparinase II/III-like protein